MDDPLSANEAASPEVQIPEAALSRFCGKCGTALSGAGADCPVCSQAARPAEPVRTFSAEMREVKSALWLYFSMFAVSVVLIVRNLSSHSPAGMGQEIFGSVAMSLVVVVWAIARRDTLLGLLSLRSQPRWYLLALVCPAATFTLASLCVGLANRLIHMPSIDYLAPFDEAGAGFGWAVLIVCVQPAIFEELAFRGVIQGTLQTIISPWQAIFASAALFAILHLSVISIPHLAVMGLVLAWLRMRSGSVYPGMIVHFLHNLLCLIDEKTGGFLPWS
jgi:CAAX protease family protein